MLPKLSAFLFLVVCVCPGIKAQTSCTALGQNPPTAFPVCGTSTFTQDTVPYCGGKRIPGPCSIDYVLDTNPFWYKFTCYTAGTLSFIITPNDLNDDYDWQLFDVTGFDANEVYTNTSLFVACNWSGNQGLTGASSAGRSLQNCAGFSYPTFSAMPLLKAGHNYLLLVSHFTQYTPSQNGYKLSFNGGSASITDTLLPGILQARSSCDASRVMVALNKKMKCSSLAPDGSDFIISPAAGGITAATGIGCNNSFDLDSVALTLNSALPPGTYTVSVKAGADQNTLLDNCDRSIAPGVNVPLVIPPIQPTPMDSLSDIGCAPESLRLVFSNPIGCNSVAPDGSDFKITGPTPVSILQAGGNCANGFTNSIDIVLSAPVVKQGNYEIILVRGSDGNTLIDQCGQETPAGSALSFTTKDTVSAAFTYTLLPGCKTDTVSFTNAGSNGIDQWRWDLGLAGTSFMQNPVIYFQSAGDKQIILAVSNGLCRDTAVQTIAGGNDLEANFTTNASLCPEDTAVFVNTSRGDITGFAWDFENGITSRLQTPMPVNYPVLSAEKIYQVRLTATNTRGCLDTAIHPLKVLKSCYIAVPNAFTPNGDGLNDYLYPVNAYKADDLEFSVYNRTGQRVFYTNDRTEKWDGKIKADPQDSGVYVWTLHYTHQDTGKKVFQKGSSVLIR